MAFSYSKLIRQAALRVSAVRGATASLADKQTAYLTSPQTTTETGSIDFPLAALQDAAISAVARITRAIANTKNHTFRNALTSQTANIAHKAAIPSVNSASKQIIGVYGAIRDAVSFDVLTEQPKQIIETIVSNSDSFLKGSYKYYKIIDSRIYHTTANVVIDVIVFDEATERGNLASGNVSLPDGTFDLCWTAMLAILMNDDSFVSQSQVYESYVQNGLNQLMNGATNFLPAPEMIGSNAVGVS